MRAIVTEGRLTGTLAAIPSKSCAHRLLICALLADGPTVLDCARVSEDIRATAGCLEALGASVTYANGQFTVTPPETVRRGALLDCHACGATLRFMLPTVCALGAEASFTGTERLAARPLSPLYEVLQEHGAVLSPQGRFPLVTGGRLTPGRYVLAANVSSQFVGGLLFALPLLEGESVLELTERIESRPYIEMTLDALARFGVTVEVDDDGRQMRIPGRQRFRSPGRIAVEGDWSNSAFWLTAGALGGPVTVTGLDPASRQGDRAILTQLERFGAKVTVERDAVTVAPGALRGQAVDGADIPDLVPILAVLAAGSAGETVFSHIRRLRLKESDRVASVCRLVEGLGGTASGDDDTLSVTGGRPLAGGTVAAEDDHRIVMAAAVAAALCRGAVTITGAEAVGKSYPAFFEDFRQLGGQVTEEEEV